MWILSPLLPGGVTYYLNSSKEYVVGRKNCDVLLANDQSISRAHAHLTVTDQTLTLKDSSKYGTFVNSQRVAANTTVNLKSGDSITFGVFESKFSVSYQRPVVCSSCLDLEGKAQLTQAVSSLGGKLVGSWSEDCTHLVMPTAKVTIKTICALLCCRPIVKPEFFSELSRAAQQKLPPPTAESFLPELDEPSLNKEDVNLGAVPGRRQLFSGKTFVFLTAKQLKRLSAAVGFGGGRTQLLDEGSLPRDLLESPQSCVIDAVAGSSQLPLPSSTSQWVKSVSSIVERKGLRIITEAEVGLATIYASCDQHCNPSSRASDAESVPKINPRIPSASLSQSVAVDETVMAAASQNITAYAVNTEPSQGTSIGNVTGVTTVGETPEKKPNPDASRLQAATERTTQRVVADTMSCMYNTVESTDSQRRKPAELKQAGNGGVRPHPHRPMSNGGTKTFQYRSPQKPKVSPQASPQKQATLTSFFQPVGKKRPLEDDSFAEMSESKRPVPDPSFNIQTPNASATSKKTPSRSDGVAARDPQGSEDLFGARSEPLRASHAAQEQPLSRKRKEVEAEIEMCELESIMFEDMDFDESPSRNQGPQAQPITPSLAVKKLGLNTAEASSSSSSSSKRRRLDLEEAEQKPQVEKESSSTTIHRQKQPIVSVKTEPLNPAESTRAASSSTNKNNDGFDEDEASFVEDLELLEAEISLSQEERKPPLKTVAVKVEVKEMKIDEDLPKKLVLVEFRSLSVSAPPKNKPQKMQNIGFTKNFKCFRKAHVPGSNDSAPVIRGSDLLAHNRGKNSDLDEWLKDAAEDERQSRRDESVGDDLFRYNPTKLTKRR